jgi:hypothetical protein
MEYSMRRARRTLSCLTAALLLLTAALSCSGPAMAGGREWVRHAGEVYAIQVPGRPNKQKLSLADAEAIAATHRFIYVNASLKTVPEALSEATSLSNALGRQPAVLVYMPRHVMDGQRNDYNSHFQRSLRELIRHALRDGRDLLVAGKSYGVNQALRVVREFDTPKILLIGISPAFGAFGNVGSPMVARYIRDVKDTRSRYCMIAEAGDVFPWNAGGAAAGRGPQIVGDPRVYAAMQDNRANVDTVLLEGTGHGMDHYLEHGLVGGMQRCATHWGYQDTAIGDVLFGRAVAGTGTGVAPGHDISWLTPLIFLPNM